jgi:alkylation response protein AidB-like acyl-CoA dehydrogenase
MEAKSFERTKTLATIRELVEKEIILLEPLLLNHEYDVLAEKRQMAKSLGFWFPQIPPKYGGMGLSLFEYGQDQRFAAFGKMIPLMARAALETTGMKI